LADRTKAASTLGKRLTQARLHLAARREREVPKTEVAAVVGVRSQSVARWEGDEQEPTLATLRALARFLEVDVAWLAFGAPYPMLDAAVTQAMRDQIPDAEARVSDPRRPVKR
jgi:transcriptional regulator with XRE-family HTH domain